MKYYIRDWKSIMTLTRTVTKYFTAIDTHFPIFLVVELAILYSIFLYKVKRTRVCLDHLVCRCVFNIRVIVYARSKPQFVIDL